MPSIGDFLHHSTLSPHLHHRHDFNVTAPLKGRPDTYDRSTSHENSQTSQCWLDSTLFANLWQVASLFFFARRLGTFKEDARLAGGADVRVQVGDKLRQHIRLASKDVLPPDQFRNMELRQLAADWGIANP